AHPALQVLPLALRLAWGPVDPETLLALLSLPQGPVPSRLAYALLRALGEQPGLGSQAWEQAIAAATADAEDPDGNTRQTIADWLSVPERRWGDPLPVDEVKARCQRVAAWAARRAGMFEGEGRDTLAAAYWLASGQAKALGDLAATTGGALSEAQLMKMLEAVRGEGAGTQPRPERAGAPRLARTLAEVEAPCARLIWLGLGTEQGKVRRWTALERAQLAGRGVEVDDGAGEADARRRAERRGLARASEALVAVALPGDAEKRPHPVWLQLLSALEAGEVRDPVALESLAAGDGEALVGPWEVARLTTPRAPQPGRRPLWPLPPGLLVDRDQSSASELEVRLQCPLRWVCYYQAGLRKGFVASLPADALLMGTFCHDVLRRVLGGGGPLPSVEAALGQVGQVFDERLPLDAAPLALPAKAVQALELRQQLLSATSTLVSALAAGGYRVAGMEVPVTGTVEDRALTGSIDCLGVTGQGEEAVVDLKYGKGSRAAQLEEGRALQLATYARARSQEAGGRTPAVGYLILREAVLHTPSGSRLRGDGPLNVVEGPAIDQVWQTFVTALRNTEAWLSGAEPVPARPLQAPEDWPQEVRLGLEGALGVSSYGKRYPACEYCDYGLICGLKELR
ncbi:MAG: PD-(D/E)XK nuclease family protein, partial [Polyangia bacterium]|nr:PD-(D/E)XK nuclease family protein [Polyangia bacterium]